MDVFPGVLLMVSLLSSAGRKMSRCALLAGGREEASYKALLSASLPSWKEQALRLFWGLRTTELPRALLPGLITET